MVSLHCCSPHTRCTADQAPYMHLFGDTHLTEKLEDFRFQVSPDSFFQVNTAAAAVLYKTVVDLAGLTHMTTLLDVCSGTGQVCYCIELLFWTRLSYLPESGGENNIHTFLGLLQSSCKKAAISLHPNVMTWLHMDRFSRNFIFRIFTKNCCNMTVLVKIGQK